jgi:MFS superfamily sulfate permease-like transporter
VLLSLCFFTNTLKYFPTSTLAAVVLCALPPLIRIHKCSAVFWKSKSKFIILIITTKYVILNILTDVLCFVESDLIPLHATFWGCLFGGLDVGMVAGILSNIVILLYDAARPKLSINNIQVSSEPLSCVHIIFIFLISINFKIKVLNLQWIAENLL